MKQAPAVSQIIAPPSGPAATWWMLILLSSELRRYVASISSIASPSTAASPSWSVSGNSCKKQTRSKRTTCTSTSTTRIQVKVVIFTGRRRSGRNYWYFAHFGYHQLLVQENSNRGTLWCLRSSYDSEWQALCGGTIKFNSSIPGMNSCPRLSGVRNCQALFST